MNLSLFEPTYSVSALLGEVREVLGEVFRSAWVAGELQRFKPSPRGHVFFELVEKGTGDEVVGRVDAVIWKTDWLRIQRELRRAGASLADGLQVRLRGGFDLYPPQGRLQLVVRDVDPVYALGALAKRRRETLAALAAAGLLERNRQLALAEVPLHLALVTSRGSAAYHDFVATLQTSGYGFRLSLLHASVQGAGAEAELVAALSTAGARAAALGFDAVVLVRGGGARTDLQVFDAHAVAEAIARSPIPVLTGLGHEIDEAVADLVAHRSFRTPTAVGEYLVSRWREADLRVMALAGGLARACAERLEAQADTLARSERALRAVARRLVAADRQLRPLAERLMRAGRRRAAAARSALGQLTMRLATRAPRIMLRPAQRADGLAARLALAGRGRIAAEELRLQGLARLAAGLSPKSTLRRGFSITRDAGGRVLRDAAAVTPGSELVTELAAGSVRSRAE
jgi:exodeoxyribonuclease VII large subunit